MANLLDMEMADIAASLRAGFTWWTGELAGMAAPLLRPRGAGCRTIATPDGRGGFDLLDDGRPAGALKGRHAVPAALELPPAAWLLRDTAAEGFDEAEWRRLLTDDIDRLTPFQGSDAYVAIRFLRGADGGRRAWVGVAPRSPVDTLVAEALACGLRPTAVLGRTADGSGLDFLPAILSGGRFGRTARSQRLWWSMVALLAAANVGAAVWRDVVQTRRLETLVAGAQPAADRIRRLQAELGGETARRTAMDQQRAGGDPLQVIARLTQALPDGAWAERLSVAGRDIRLAGRRRLDADVAAALRAQGFVDVRDAATDLAPADVAPGSAQSFDLTFRTPAPRPGGAAR